MRQKASLIVLTIAVLFLSGCATFGIGNQTILYPIQDDDIYSVPAGAVVHIPAGTTVKDDKGKVIQTYTKDQDTVVKKNGWILSDFYLQEVVNAKLKK